MTIFAGLIFATLIYFYISKNEASPSKANAFCVVNECSDDIVVDSIIGAHNRKSDGSLEPVFSFPVCICRYGSNAHFVDTTLLVEYPIEVRWYTKKDIHAVKNSTIEAVYDLQGHKILTSTSFIPKSTGSFFLILGEKKSTLFWLTEEQAQLYGTLRDLHRRMNKDQEAEQSMKVPDVS